ncbi:unnamed protein product [Dimorphilus gyrociliatus]|uniref:Nudix hydrolase domain-containing protein n=1 Tax=Dimorphilus gyrociliatus TaxID=2664684 RepID=A0A7I8V7K2_9ANNE|nr:unnamed protein product [Dimorphilus gyrociliatus]
MSTFVTQKRYFHPTVTKDYIRRVLRDNFQCEEFTLAGEKGKALRGLANSSCYAILIKMIEGHPHMLCTIRSSSVTLSKGWVVPAGGMIDDGETEIEAAKREAYEEIGLPMEDFDIIGGAKPLPMIFSTNKQTHFYLSWSIFGLVPDNFTPVINEEVEDYFYIPLYEFVDQLDSSHSITEVDYFYDQKVFYHNFKWTHKNKLYKISGAVGHIGLISAIAIYQRKKYVKFGPVIEVSRHNLKHVNDWFCYTTVNFLKKHMSPSKL